MELRPPSSLGAATSPHTNVLVVTVWDTVTNSQLSYSLALAGHPYGCYLNTTLGLMRRLRG